MSQVEYSRVIGCIMYLMSCKRLDIAYAVNRLSRYMSSPRAMHWQRIARVLKYLRFTHDYGLYYTRYPAALEGYSDVVSWKSSKQTVIARYTMEYEFIALDKCGEEAQ